MTGQASGSFTTGLYGDYFFNHVPFGSQVRLTPSHPDYTFSPQYRDVVADKAFQSIIFEATPKAQFGVSGRLLGLNGQPLAGASVYLAGQFEGSTFTDSQGNYAFLVPYAASVSVVPKFPGLRFIPELKVIQEITQDFANLNFSSAAALEMHMISGTVHKDSQAFGQFYIDLQDGAGSLNVFPDGTYKLGAPHGSALVLQPRYSGLSTYMFQPPLRSYSSIISDLANQDFNAIRTEFSIQGRVTSGGYGIPSVRVSDGIHSTYSDSYGSFVISHVPPGSYTLVASLAGYQISPSNFSNPVVISDDDVQFLEFVTNEPTHCVVGYMTDTGGQYMTGKEIVVSGSISTTIFTHEPIVDNWTNFSLCHLPLGANVTLVPNVPGYFSSPDEISVTLNDGSVFVWGFTMMEQGPPLSSSSNFSSSAQAQSSSSQVTYSSSSYSSSSTQLQSSSSQMQQSSSSISTGQSSSQSSVNSSSSLPPDPSSSSGFHNSSKSEQSSVGPPLSPQPTLEPDSGFEPETPETDESCPIITALERLSILERGIFKRFRKHLLSRPCHDSLAEYRKLRPSLKKLKIGFSKVSTQAACQAFPVYWTAMRNLRKAEKILTQLNEGRAAANLQGCALKVRMLKKLTGLIYRATRNFHPPIARVGGSRAGAIS